LSGRATLFQHFAVVAASRQRAAFFAPATEAGGALPRRRYGVLTEARPKKGLQKPEKAIYRKPPVSEKPASRDRRAVTGEP